MKPNLKITLVILVMFLITQAIGLYVIGHYSNPDNPLPYGMDTPSVENQSEFYTSLLPSIVIAFIFAILLFVLLTKFKLAFVMKLWFFFVVMLALGITLTSFFPNIQNIQYIVLIFILPLAILKTYKSNLLAHNFTELFIYPGIAAVFVPLLNFWTMIFLLILISLYDAWAVWHSGIMQKMAKYQMNELKVFGGFLVPYLTKKQKIAIKKAKESKKSKDKKIKVNIAVLGGGDIVFTLIAAGVMMSVFGLAGAIFTILGATLGLSYLLFAAKKKKFYPAMPFITAGIFLGIILSWALLG